MSSKQRVRNNKYQAKNASKIQTTTKRHRVRMSVSTESKKGSKKRVDRAYLAATVI